jgi:hypothetical protein
LSDLFVSIRLRTFKTGIRSVRFEFLSGEYDVDETEEYD